MKPVPIKRTKKSDRQRQVLMGMIELYIATGKPVGSNTLKEFGFDDLSSATIRNYFVRLEEEGYLHQAHTSGGRTPSNAALRLYAREFERSTALVDDDRKKMSCLRSETKEISTYLQHAAETLADTTQLAVFLSAPRFDHDFILGVKIVRIDEVRFLCVLITDFGSIIPELLHADGSLSDKELTQIEAYFIWRLVGEEIKSPLSDRLKEQAQKLYNEAMVRYVTRYSNFTEEDLLRTGFSRLLHYPEFANAQALASGLSLFESATRMRAILREAEQSHETPRFWVGDDLTPYLAGADHCTVIAVPYFVNGIAVGAIGLLGPTRIPYRRLFGLLRLFSDEVSATLSDSLYKYRISYRQPAAGTDLLPRAEQKLLSDKQL